MRGHASHGGLVAASELNTREQLQRAAPSLACRSLAALPTQSSFAPNSEKSDNPSAAENSLRSPETMLAIIGVHEGDGSVVGRPGRPRGTEGYVGVP